MAKYYLFMSGMYFTGLIIYLLIIYLFQPTVTYIDFIALIGLLVGFVVLGMYGIVTTENINLKK